MELNMKKNLLKAIIAFCVISNVNYLKAQTVPNNSFENWGMSGTFEHPVVAPAPLFESSNYETFYQYGGLINVTEVAGVTGSAMRVENILSPSGDTLKGFAAWGNVSGGSMSDGIPLPALMPLTGCNVSVRYNVNPVTAGFIAFIPTTGGSASGLGNGIYPGAYIYPISGTQSTFAAMNYTFSPALTLNPDSCIVVVTCADVISSDMGTPGDFLEVDNFVWTGTTDVFSGGNLDIWQPVPAVEIPMDWNVNVSPNNLTFAKSMDAAAGNYSLLLKNIVTGSDTRMGQATMGSWDCPPGGGPCVMRPGMSLSSTPKGFGFYYKYSTPGVDTASAYVNLMAAGVGVSGGWVGLLPTSTWTFQSVMMPTPGTTPDSAFISFESGRWMSAVNNSTLLVDDVKFHYCNEVATINGPTSVCANSSGVIFSINNEFANGYTWSTTTGTINGSSTMQSVMIDNIAANGTITVIKNYADGCPPMTFNLPITVTAASSANAGISQTVCSANASVNLSGSVVGATGGNWTTSGTGTFIDPSNLNTTYMPTPADIGAGIVTLTLTPTGTGTCPTTSGQMTVTFIASPTVSAGADQTVCFGTMVTLNGSGGAITYTWDGGVSDGTPFASPVGTVVYTVTGTAANSCTNTDMVSVTTNPLPSVSFNLATDTVCNTSSTFALSGGLPTGGVYSGTGVSGGNFSPVTAGVGTFSITYTYTDVNSCQASMAQNIVVEVCTSVDNASNEMITKMFPNPTTGILNIEVNNGNKNYDLYLTDVTGRELFKTTSDKKTFALDMEEYSNGVYFIRLVSEGSTINKRIVKE